LGDIFVFNGTSWVPTANVSSSGNATSVGSIPLSGTPTVGQVLIYDGTNWVPTDVVAVSGNATSISGFNVGSGTPADNDVLTWVAANSDWEPMAPSGGGGSSPVVAVALAIQDDGPTLNPGVGGFTEVILKWNTQVIDTDGLIPSGTFTVMTIPSGKDGYYRASAKVAIASSGSAAAQIGFKVNGTLVGDSGYSFGGASTNDATIFAEYIGHFDVGDTISVFHFNQTVSTHQDYSNNNLVFSMHKIN
jgi:hypothetical protein